MSKEMIISVNGREKKIAVLDNGKVTEFYIERGEENSGVVGNVYKGRVMRVLPGMQSAFVEIGLERDAFLYVSDFFDEEEEIERIVMEKSKKSTAEEAKREADERIARARIEREKQMEAVQELAEPLAHAPTIPDEPVAEPEPEKKSGRGGRRGRNEKRNESPRPTATQSEPEFQTAEAPQSLDLELEFDDSGFERVIDDDDTGEMFKDAFLQEAIVDKVRAVEFDIEPTTAAEVGSLIDSVGQTDAGFQRIADEDEEPTASVKGKGRAKSSGKAASEKAKPKREAK